MKKIVLVISFIAFSFLFSLTTVLADCSDCGPFNCAECGCVVNDGGTGCIYPNFNAKAVSCGGGMVENIPASVPKVVSVAYTTIQIAVPVVLVIFGMLDLFKGITAGKEDEIKKGQQIFIKRLISAALIFFVFVIVKVVISLVADGSGVNIMECAECFISNKCDS